MDARVAACAQGECGAPGVSLERAHRRRKVVADVIQIGEAFFRVEAKQKVRRGGAGQLRLCIQDAVEDRAETRAIRAVSASRPGRVGGKVIVAAQ